MQFYGGLVLIGLAPGRWVIVGAILAADVVFAPVLVRIGDGRG